MILYNVFVWNTGFVLTWTQLLVTSRFCICLGCTQRQHINTDWSMQDSKTGRDYDKGTLFNSYIL